MAESGTTTVGPHRADFSVRHAQTGMAAAECSTGEQKALLVAVLLAQARLQAGLRGAPPVMLLDEVTAHLDGKPTEHAGCAGDLRVHERDAGEPAAGER